MESSHLLCKPSWNSEENLLKTLEMETSFRGLINVNNVQETLANHEGYVTE
jgi:hypothetical protein